MCCTGALQSACVCARAACTYTILHIYGVANRSIDSCAFCHFVEICVRRGSLPRLVWVKSGPDDEDTVEEKFAWRKSNRINSVVWKSNSTAIGNAYDVRVLGTRQAIRKKSAKVRVALTCLGIWSVVFAFRFDWARRGGYATHAVAECHGSDFFFCNNSNA